MTFDIVDIGPMSFYLDLKIHEWNQKKRTIKLSQPIYIYIVLAKYYFDKANLINMPIKEAILGPNLSEAMQDRKEKYNEMTRSPMFSMIEIRPDIMFFITVATCLAKNPSHAYTKAIKIIFCYLKRLINCDITYGSDGKNLSIKGYSDLNLARDKKSQLSTLGFVFILSEGSVSWCLDTK